MGWFVFVLFLPLLTGCTVNTAHAPEDGVAEMPTPLATATLAPNTAVIFKRSGGIAGVNEEWIIFTDGRIQTNSSIQPQLTSEEVSQLLSSLESAGFFALNNSYLPDDTCCDRYLYEITAVQNTTYHTVNTLENTPDMPEALQQSLRLLETVLFADSTQ